jgi:aconitate hydratase
MSSKETNGGAAFHVPTGDRFVWDEHSTYIRKPPFVEDISREPAPLKDIVSARVLALLGDSVTTDHISPAGSIPKDSPAGKYLIDQGVAPGDFNSYGARRGNHEVMMRGTFANIRLRNQLAPGTEGGWTLHQPDCDLDDDLRRGHEVSGRRGAVAGAGGEGIRVGVFAGLGREGTLLLGVRVVIAETFERIHRSNLVNMGVLPLQFKAGDTAASLKLTGAETYDVAVASLKPRSTVQVRVQPSGAPAFEFEAVGAHRHARRAHAFRHGGILPYVLRQLVDQNELTTGRFREPFSRTVGEKGSRNPCTGTKAGEAHEEK